MTITLVIAAVWAIAVAAIGALLSDISAWYKGLRKPSWQPPDWAFGPAWTVILALAAFAGARAWSDAPDASARALVIVLFAINSAFHIGWSLLFFRLRRPDWAVFEVPFLWLSILALILAFAPFAVIAAWALAPYLAWVGFAAFLNLTIVRLNRPFAATRHAGTSP